MLAADDEAWRLRGDRRRFATRVGGTLVGGCEARVDGRVAALSYWTFPQHRGRGYATRATRLLSAWAASEFGAERIEVRVDADNTASLRVATRAGFVDTGRRDRAGQRVLELRSR